MWRIEEHRRVDKQAASAPMEVLKRYEKWKDIAAMSGPMGLRLIKGFHDEALAGEWKGHRSSRLGDQWRVIYRVVADETPFQVASITAHDYRRPGPSKHCVGSRIFSSTSRLTIPMRRTEPSRAYSSAPRFFRSIPNWCTASSIPSGMSTYCTTINTESPISSFPRESHGA